MTDVGSAKQGWCSLKLGCVLVGIVAVIACVAWVWQDSQRGWTKKKLERLIAKEIPAGCDRSQVEAWFDKHRIRHQYDEGTTEGRSGNYTMPMLAGLRDQDVIGTEHGSIEGKEANVGLLESGRISVFFFFDKQGRMVGHLVYELIYSL